MVPLVGEGPGLVIFRKQALAVSETGFIKGQYSGQKSLFLPQPGKSGKAISSPFFAVFSAQRLTRKQYLYQKRSENQRYGAKRQNFWILRLEIAGYYLKIA